MMYMPLLHAEDVHVQERSVHLYQEVGLQPTRSSFFSLCCAESFFFWDGWLDGHSCTRRPKVPSAEHWRCLNGSTTLPTDKNRQAISFPLAVPANKKYSLYSLLLSLSLSVKAPIPP